MWWIVLIEGLVISLVGSILHFTFAWSRGNKFVAIFAAVNESTWEHIKLALSSVFFCTLVDVWFLGDNPNYWFAKSLEFITPIVVIPAIFYGYTAIVKKSILAIDISLFFVAAFASAGVFVGGLSLPAISTGWQALSMTTAVVVMVAFLLLTRFPLHNFLFRDPINGRYGLGAVKKDGKLRKGRQKAKRRK